MEPYTYDWSTGAATAMITDLPAGMYTCTITDANGCSITTSVTISEPSQLVVTGTTQTDVLCFGDNSGTADVQVAGGVAPYTYLWSNNATDASVTALTASLYSCVIKDANGCSVSTSVSIAGPAAPLAAVASKTDLLCFNDHSGKASVTVSGGTALYAYAWSNGETGSALDNIAPGTYTCTITDANGCELEKSISITEPALLNVSVSSQVNAYCNTGTGLAQIQAGGGVMPYAYLWSNGNTGNRTGGLAAGNYSCVVTDANGCTTTVPVTITSQAYSGNKIFVDNAVAVSGDGTSWAQAIRQLTDAFSIANSCTGIDSILIAKGTYTTEGNAGINNMDTAFVVRKSGGLKIYGGYPSGGGLRNPAENKTILSAEMNIANYVLDNGAHVMVIAGLDASADSVVLDGLTFHGGNGTSRPNYFYNGIEVSAASGGAICLIDNNDAGGKIFIRDCRFTDNYASMHGAAIYCSQSSPVIVNCEFSSNRSWGKGGAIMNDLNSNAFIVDCEFSANRAGGGGAVYNGQGSNVRITGSRFTGNTTNNFPGGGAIGNENCSAMITNCFIGGNTAANSYGGGGIINWDNVVLKITNTVLVGNTANWNDGGAIASFGNSFSAVINCTFFRNSGGMDEAISNNMSQLDIKNSILAGSSTGIVNWPGGTASVNYCLLNGWTGGGAGNLPANTDPKFVEPGYSSATLLTGNYRLLPCSPAINSGTADTTGLNLPSDEFEKGRPRIQLGQIDMGAYEANSNANDESALIASAAVTTSAYQLKDSTTWYAADCGTLIAAVTGTGANPVVGNTTVSVNMDAALLPAYVSRSYEIEPDQHASSVSGTVTLYFTAAEFSEYNTANAASNKLPLPDKDDPAMNDALANIRIRKVSNGVETVIVPHTMLWNALHERWEISFDVTNFSKFYLFTEDNTSLPLTLISFTARRENCSAKLAFTTAEETGVSHFIVEHSSDGTAWQAVAQVAAKNTTGENRYNTELPINAAMNFYRLKMLDRDGAVTYSKVVRLAASPDCSRQFLRLFPNPALDVLYIEKVTPGDKYTIYDNTGRIVMQGVISKTIQDINVRVLVMGMYTITVTTKAGEIKALKFVRK